MAEFPGFSHPWPEAGEEKRVPRKRKDFLLKTIQYYVSGHGFGHAVRAIQVMEELHRLGDFRIRIKSGAPRWLFQRSLPFRFEYQHWDLDVQPIQTDSLTIRWEETARRGLEIYRRREEIVDREIRDFRCAGVDFVISDIPPLPLEAAGRVGIPCACVANFTWDWIYRNTPVSLPSLRELADLIGDSYSRTGLALLTPLRTEMEAFPVAEPIPLIGRESRYSREEIRAVLGIPPARAVVLLSFGGLGIDGIGWSRLEEMKDYRFLRLDDQEVQTGNVRTFSRDRVSHHDLVRAADVVVTKPGYGICAECILNRTPMVFTSRTDFPETPVLVRQTEEFIPLKEIGNDRLRSMDLVDPVETLLKKEWVPREVPGDGAAVAAKKLLTWLGN